MIYNNINAKLNKYKIFILDGKISSNTNLEEEDKVDKDFSLSLNIDRQDSFTRSEMEKLGKVLLIIPIKKIYLFF